jgi:cation diffusion facilitator CzcD-associated flavoprotein CzcO
MNPASGEHQLAELAMLADAPQQSASVCVVGAGPSGLVTVKALRDVEIACDCLEREDDVGGNWYFGSAASSVYSGTRLISSKRLTELADFPMPEAFPPYPSHQQALTYLREYAQRFDLYASITLGKSVTRVEPASSGWHVHVAGEASPRVYERVILASGHHWSPRWPNYPGKFVGEILHARDFKHPDVLRGKRVLVVGAGNSGCDIAVEAAQHAESALISMRRGYHFLPKFLAGFPVDAMGLWLQQWGVPLAVRRLIAWRYSRIALGDPQLFGVPKPDHRLFETHPIVNSQLLYYLGHGAIRVKPDIAELAGDTVRFQDGTSEPLDMIIYATGYDVSFPYIDQQHLNWRDGLPQLFLHAFHPQRDDLAVIGMIQPNGALWPLAELQAKIAAAFISAARDGRLSAAWFGKLKAQSSPAAASGIRFDRSPRHALEVDYYAFRQCLRNILKRF